MALLLGPDWINHDHVTHATVRIEVLMNPPKGSVLYAANFPLDKGGPPRTPRAASPAEIVKIRHIREMQVKLHRYLNGRKTPTEEDMANVLRMCEGEYADLVQVYMLAVNTLVRGVEVEE